MLCTMKLACADPSHASAHCGCTRPRGCTRALFIIAQDFAYFHAYLARVGRAASIAAIWGEQHDEELVQRVVVGSLLCRAAHLTTRVISPVLFSTGSEIGSHSPCQRGANVPYDLLVGRALAKGPEQYRSFGKQSNPEPAMGGPRLLLALAFVLAPTLAYVSNAYDGTAGKGNVAGTYLEPDLRFVPSYPHLT